MRFTSLLRSLALCLAPFVVFSNAADYVAVAHVIYDGNSLYYADNESSYKYQALEKGEDGTFTIYFTQERLEGSDRQGREDVRHLRFGLSCNGSTCRKNLNEGHEPSLRELFPTYENGVDSQAICEVWIIINEDSTVTISETKPEVIPTPEKKVIRFFAPWTNTNAIMYLNGFDENFMTAVPNYCGWFEAKVSPPKDDKFTVFFKQTIGGTFVGNEGVTKDSITIENEIDLDSVMKISDTVWVYAYQFGAPDIQTKYPEVLGDCPIKNLPVMMFDWFDGSVSADGKEDGFEWPRNKAAGRNGFDSRGFPMFGEGVSEDFGQKGCEAAPMTGMVEKELGPNGVPVRASNFPDNCTNAKHLDNWFLPEVIAKDSAGNEYTNVTCRELELTMTDDGFWYAQIDDSSPEGGLFFLDDFRYLDSANTVDNVYYDSLPGLEVKGVRGYHNFGFTMKIQATFQYVKGQYFEFNGDDDVWVFIDNKLVVDIGGQHQKVKKSVDLDKLGLVEDSTYNFHIFYAERKREASNFMMRTSIDLHVESSMFLTDVSDDPDVIKKDVWQKIRERVLACDFSSEPEKESTEPGPSNFVLFGRSLDSKGIPLNVLDSLYYQGITVGNDYTQLTIKPKDISKAQTLPPGTYFVRVSLKTNPADYKDVYFTVDPYELPNLAYATVIDSSYCILDIESEEGDSLCYSKYWKPFGDDSSRNVSSDTLPINLNLKEKMWAGRPYKVNIMYAEDWATMYSGISVKITMSDTLLVACDSLGNIIKEVVLDSGHAVFYVKGLGEVVNADMTLSTPGAKNGSIVWSKINMKEPPVPQVDSAFIYDRNGDGRADSIWIHFKKALGVQNVLDSIQFTFGVNDSAYKDPRAAAYNKIYYKDGDSVATIVASGKSFGTAIFTGGATEPYTGKINLFYTYIDEDTGDSAVFPIEDRLIDRVGPVITAAEIQISSEGNTELKLSFSEGIVDDGKNASLFMFRSRNADGQYSNLIPPAHIQTSPANQWTLVFIKTKLSDVIPAVGDSVRFAPPSLGGLALDLLEIPPHELNPWVRITGEQSVRITSPTIVDLDRHSPTFDSARVIMRADTATTPKLVRGGSAISADQVAAIYGTQGHYLGDLDMGELVRNEIAEIVRAVQSTASYTDKEAAENGGETVSYTIEEVLTMVSTGKMTIDDAQERFGLSDIIVDAYESGLLTVDNLHYYASGTEADIEMIAQTVASHTEMRYEATYYTSLGHFVNRHSGKIACTDSIFKEDGAQNCLDSEARFFLAWNMRATSGRIAGTGVYIARLELKVKVNDKNITNQTRDFLWGVRHGRISKSDLGL